MTVQDFINWESQSRDILFVKRSYIDITGDMMAGILLSQIVYWNLPDKDGNSKLRVKHDGALWLAKQRDEWWNECRLTAKQFDRALKILEGLGIVSTGLFKFQGSPVKHIKLNWNELITRMSTGYSPKVKNDFPQRSKWNFPKG